MEVEMEVRMIRTQSLPVLLLAFGTFAIAATTRDARPARAEAASEHGLPKRVTLATESVRVPLELGHGQPIVAVKINGKGPFNFFLDSGAGGTVLNGDLAAELGLDSVGVVRMGDPISPNGIDAKLMHVDKLEVGGATFENFHVTAWDRQFLRGVGAPRGVLGFPVYRELLATYDFPNKELVLTRGELPKSNGETVIDYVAEHNIPLIEVTVGKEKIKGHLDSGSAGFLMIPARYETKVPLKGPAKEVGKARLAASTMTLKGAQLDATLRFGGQDFVEPNIMFSELPVANVGSTLLGAFAVTFDQKNHRIGFKYDPAAGELVVAKTRPARYGIRIAPGEKAEAIVEGVDAGSPAELGGVRAGDVIKTVNGTPVEQLTIDARREAFQKSPLVLTVERGGKTVALTLTLDAAAGTPAAAGASASGGTKED
jgi:hypothetical protein